MSVEISLLLNTPVVNRQSDDSLAESRRWLARAEQTFPHKGVTVAVNGVRVTLSAPCAKCAAILSESFDMDGDAARTRRALITYRDKLSPHSVPLLCASCRPRLSLVDQPNTHPRTGSPGSNGGGRKGKATPRQSTGQRRMTFSMAVQIAGGYGYLLIRQGNGYRVKPRSGGEWATYTTLNDALASIQAVASRKAK